MIAFSCPGCQATFKLPDEMAGKSARCSKCNRRFTVPAAKPKAVPVSAPAPVAAPKAMPPKKVAVNPMPEVMEAEIIDEPAPPRRARPPEIMEAVEVVDDAVQEPRRSRPPVPARGRDDYDDDPDRRRPRRRDDDDWDDDDRAHPRRAKRGGSLGVIMACVGGGSFALMFVMLILMIVTAPTPGFVMNNAGGGGMQIQLNPQDFQNFNPNDFKMPDFPKGNPVGKGGPAPAPGPASPINLVNGSFDTQADLTAQDPIDNPGNNFLRQKCPAKRYSLQMEAGKTYTIDMIRTNPQQRIDPYLRIEQNGVSLAEDDDGGGFPNARIVFRPQQSGTYIIVATTLASQLLGNYRLTVRTTP